MPYTNKSLACLWLIILGLCALTASDVVARPWLPLLLLVALAAPTLILRSNEPVAVIARSRSRPRLDKTTEPRHAGAGPAAEAGPRVRSTAAEHDALVTDLANTY